MIRFITQLFFHPGWGFGLGIGVANCDGGSDTANHILLENGNILAAENGDHLVQE